MCWWHCWATKKSCAVNFLVVKRTGLCLEIPWFFNQNVLGPFKTNAHLNHQSAGFSKFLTTGDILILAGPLRSVSQWNCHFGSCGLGVVGCEPLSKLATKWWCEGWGMKDDVSLQVIGWKVCNEQEGKYFQIKSQRNRLWQYNKTTCHF